MSRRNRAVPAAWNQLWQMFFPWVVGIDDIPAQRPPRNRPKPKARRLAALAALAVAITLSGAAQAGDKPAKVAKDKEVAAAPVPQPAEPQAKLIPASLTKSAPYAQSTARYPKLFGSREDRYTDLRPFTKWSNVLYRFRRDFSAMKNEPTTQRWLHFLEASYDLSDTDKINAVNRYMNKVKFISDSDRYGQSDYWATPMQFLKGGGDCEDYAFAKYVSLRALGFKEKDMRVAIVFDHQMQMPHALLVVYTKKGAVILDNQEKDVKRAVNVTRYQPIYSINQQSWWRHS